VTEFIHRRIERIEAEERADALHYITPTPEARDELRGRGGNRKDKEKADND
jgi:hypothetical protein